MAQTVTKSDHKCSHMCTAIVVVVVPGCNWFIIRAAWKQNTFHHASPAPPNNAETNIKSRLDAIKIR
jgi:hypothetical protein